MMTTEKTDCDWYRLSSLQIIYDELRKLSKTLKTIQKDISQLKKEQENNE